MLYQAEREAVCTVAASMFDRWITNAAGGNISIRVGNDRYVMTASKLSAQRLWKIDPEDVLVVDGSLNVLEGRGKPTREINMHLRMYAADQRLGAVIHAHPRESMVYAALGRDVPIITECMEYLGSSIPCLPYQKAVTVELADEVAKWTRSFAPGMAERQQAAEDIYAYAALLAKHGVIVGGEDIWQAIDMLERVETNSYVALRAAVLEHCG
ncbi:MAG: class II aldolase/adducin family protein [Propionibacteriaceae bacterium]|jgi:L-fuculose-phosphate aldolase|nr:class II aldolase/adducin family protein [Propionibacteriaceae bacterium]